MSFLTGTNTELIYASTAAGASYNTSTTQTLLNTAGSSGMGPQAHLPPDFWLPTPNSVGRGIRVVARGIISTTTGPPTFTFGVYLGATLATTTQILGSAAITTVASVTTQYVELQGDFVLTAIQQQGTNSSGRGMGTVTSPGGFAAPYTYALYGGAAQPGTIANVDTSITNYINVMGTWSASSASNAFILEQLLVFGLN